MAELIRATERIQGRIRPAGLSERLRQPENAGASPRLLGRVWSERAVSPSGGRLRGRLVDRPAVVVGTRRGGCETTVVATATVP